MEAKRVLRAMVEHSGKSKADISRAMGRSDNYIGVTLAKGTVPQADTLARIAKACGYKVYVEGQGERLEVD